jgi:hypothetical protein
MRFTTVQLVALAACLVPASGNAVPTNDDILPRAAGDIHCTPHSTDGNAVLRAFDDMANLAIIRDCGNRRDHSVDVNAKGKLELSKDHKYKFYICNQHKNNRCMTLGSDKRKKLVEAKHKCAGKGFWIDDGSSWSYGGDPVEIKECGH